MHDPECPICRVAIARAPYRTKDRRGVVIEHEPEPATWELYEPKPQPKPESTISA